MAYELQIDELNTFDHESYVEEYFKPMRISKERKEERKQASRDFRDYLLFIFMLLGVQSEYNAVNWAYIEDQYRREFERAALQYARMSQALTDYIAEKASDFVNVTRENIDKGNYWTSDERATYEAVNEANDVVGLEEYQRAIEEGETHKVWHTERDNCVRDTHRVMEGVKIPITEMFEVGNGLMRYPHDWYYNPAECPNCRCSCEYTGSGGKVNKTDEKVQYTSERSNGIIQSNSIPLYRKGDTHRKSADDGHKIIDKALYHRITNPAIKAGAYIKIVDGKDEDSLKILERLNRENATAVTYGNTILFREDATVSDVLEEVHHFYQNKAGLNSQYGYKERIILNEIDAKEYVLSMEKKYHIPEDEIVLTKKQLASYQKQMENLKMNGEWHEPD